MITPSAPDIIGDAMISQGRLSDFLRLLSNEGFRPYQKQPHPGQREIKNFRLNPAGLNLRPAPKGQAPVVPPQGPPEETGLLKRLRRLDEFFQTLLS
jgi:hypothetical protein